jgi:hypothetical protein
MVRYALERGSRSGLAPWRFTSWVASAASQNTAEGPGGSQHWSRWIPALSVTSWPQTCGLQRRQIDATYKPLGCLYITPTALTPYAFPNFVHVCTALYIQRVCALRCQLRTASSHTIADWNDAINFEQLQVLAKCTGLLLASHGPASSTNLPAVALMLSCTSSHEPCIPLMCVLLEPAKGQHCYSKSNLTVTPFTSAAGTNYQHAGCLPLRLSRNLSSQSGPLLSVPRSRGRKLRTTAQH